MAEASGALRLELCFGEADRACGRGVQPPAGAIAVVRQYGTRLLSRSWGRLPRGQRALDLEGWCRIARAGRRPARARAARRAPHRAG
jgi:hypothetical protein